MKGFVILLLCVLIVLNFSSCTKFVYIGKKIDPEINTGKGDHDIVFVNLFDFTSPENVRKKDETAYHDGVMSLLEGLSQFSSDSTFIFSVGDTLKKGIGKGLLTTLLPEDSIRVICRRSKSNLLLALDSVSIFFEWEINVNNNDKGILSETWDFYLNTRFFLSLYSVTGELINRSELDQSSFYGSSPVDPGIITVKPSLGRARDDIITLAFQAGQDYIDKFYPKITKETRQLYTGKQFRESNRYIFSKDWTKAAELLEVLTKNQDPEIADKAKHNLDIVKEASDASAR
jgi:hypothetical protein